MLARNARPVQDSSASSRLRLAPRELFGSDKNRHVCVSGRKEQRKGGCEPVARFDRCGGARRRNQPQSHFAPTQIGHGPASAPEPPLHPPAYEVASPPC